MKTLKKSLAVVLSLAVALSMVAVPPKAVAAGDTITLASQHTIPADKDASGEHWSYNAATKTLTLKEGFIGSKASLSSTTDLTLELTGNSSLSYSNVSAAGTLTIKGNGSLKIQNVPDAAISADKIIFDGGNLDVKVDSGAAVKANQVVINNGTMYLKGGSGIVAKGTYATSKIEVYGGSTTIQASNKKSTISGFKNIQIGTSSDWLERSYGTEDHQWDKNVYVHWDKNPPVDQISIPNGYLSIRLAEAMRGTAYIVGDIKAGSTSSVQKKLDDEPFLGEIHYQWFDTNAAKIEGATNASYKWKEKDLGGTGTPFCIITCDNRAGSVFAKTKELTSLFFDAAEGKLYSETFDTTKTDSWTPKKDTPYQYNQFNSGTVSCKGNVLTLNGFSCLPNSTQVGIITKGDAVIVLKGENEIAEFDAAGGAYGIYAYDNLSITGDGSLEVKANLAGIEAKKDLTVETASLIVGGNRAIGANNYTQTSGSVVAENKKNNGYTGTIISAECVKVAETFDFKGGTLTAYSKIGSQYNSAILASAGIQLAKGTKIVGGSTKDTASESNVALGKNSFSVPDTNKSAAYVSLSYKPATDITIKNEKGDTDLEVGDKDKVTADIGPDDADNKKIVWSTSDDKVVTVDEDGNVTAVGPGTATITGTNENGDVTDQITYTVKEKTDDPNGNDPNGNDPNGNDPNGNNPNGNDPNGNNPNGNNPNGNNPGGSGNTNINTGGGNGADNGNEVGGKNPGENGGTTAGNEISTDTLKNNLNVDDKTAADIKDYATTNNISQDTLLITDKTVTTAQSDDDFKGSTFGILKAKCTKMTKKSLTITWTKVPDADGYIVYGNKCGKKNIYKKIKTVNKNTTTKLVSKKLKKGTYYKYFVMAFKKINGCKVTIAASKTVHATTNGGKYGVAKAVKIKKIPSSVAVGKTVKIGKATEVKMKKKIQKHRKICYESSDSTIAKVNKSGKITGVAKGKCTIYVYAQNGVYKQFDITVK